MDKPEQGVVTRSRKSRASHPVIANWGQLSAEKTQVSKTPPAT